MELELKKTGLNLVGVSKRVPMQFKGVNKEIVKLAEKHHGGTKRSDACSPKH